MQFPTQELLPTQRLHFWGKTYQYSDQANQKTHVHLYSKNELNFMAAFVCKFTIKGTKGKFHV